MNNVVITAAIIIGASWTWGSIGMMQRNYTLQKEVDTKKRDEQLTNLEVQTLTYEQNYYHSAEYQDLAMRMRLGMADPGEKALILPPNSQTAINEDQNYQDRQVKAVPPESNFQQWTNFLFGADHSK